jgi:hypothetical protein
MNKDEIMAILERMEINKIKEFTLTYEGYDCDKKQKTVTFKG